MTSHLRCLHCGFTAAYTAPQHTLRPDDLPEGWTLPERVTGARHPVCPTCSLVIEQPNPVAYDRESTERKRRFRWSRRRRDLLYVDEPSSYRLPPEPVTWDETAETFAVLRHRIRATLGTEWSLNRDRRGTGGRLLIRYRQEARQTVRPGDTIEFVHDPTPHLLVHPKPARVAVSKRRSGAK